MVKKIIIDGHLDIAWNKQSLNRDFLISTHKKNCLDSEEIKQNEGVASVGFEELILGNIKIICATIWVEPKNSFFPSMGIKYNSIQEAKKQAQQQLNYYLSLEKEDNITIIRSKNDLKNILSESLDYRLGICITIEGAEYIESIEDLNYWYKKGVRIVAPIWQENKYGGCSVSGGGLTDKGKNLIQALNCHEKMILDIAHMSEQSALDSIDLYEHIVINSHTNCQTLSPGERQISDNLINKIHKKGGIVALMLWNKTINSQKKNVSLDDYIKHIFHIFNLTGSFDSIAIGSSLDGGFGSESLPVEMKNIGDLHLISHKLSDMGLSDDDIEKILFKNWLRVLTKVY